MKNINSIKRKYCTTSLLSKIEKLELDYDPFLNAQDSDADWLKNLSVRKDSKKEIYIVSYKNSNEEIIIKLSVVKKEGVFKIDAIL